MLLSSICHSALVTTDSVNLSSYLIIIFFYLIIILKNNTQRMTLFPNHFLRNTDYMHQTRKPVMIRIEHDT